MQYVLNNQGIDGGHIIVGIETSYSFVNIRVVNQ
jgi:hypothetical protein